MRAFLLVVKLPFVINTMVNITILEKEMATHLSIPAWDTHEQRSLVGYSPWGRIRVRHN